MDVRNLESPPEPRLRPFETREAPAPEATLDLRDLLGMLRRHALLVAAFMLAFGGVSAYLASRVPPAYLSTATVRMTNQRDNLAGSLGSPAADRVMMGRRDPLLSQMEVLRSRDLLARVVDREGLRLRPLGALPAGVLAGAVVPADPPADTVRLTFRADRVEARAGAARAAAAYGAPLALGGMRFTVVRNPGVETGELVVVPRAVAVRSLQDRLNARPRAETDLFDLSYVSGDPEEARRVLDASIDEFQKHNVQQARQLSQRRRVFIEEQLGQSTQELARAQFALSQFRRTQQVYSSREDFASEQEGLRDLELRREEMDAERQISRNLLAVAEQRGADTRALRSVVSSPAMAQNPVVQQLYDQLVRYEAQRDSMLTGPYRSAENAPDVERLNQLISGTQARIADAVRSQIQSLDARITALDGIRDRRSARIQGLPEVEAEEVRLTEQLTSLQKVADELRTELQKARISEAVEAGQVEVVDRAALPTAPMPRHRGLRVLLGLAFGLMVGGAAAVVREKMNTAVTARDDLERLLSLPTLAVIPQAFGPGRGGLLAGWRRNGTPAAPSPNGNGRHPRPGMEALSQGTLDPSVVSALHKNSSAAEAYRRLRTNLLFAQATPLRSLVVTSATPSEGKTTTSTNLAVTYAQQGLRVVLLDCDLRRPRVHHVFGLERSPGLSELILGYATVDQVVMASPVENLSVVASGTPPPNPAELLGGPRMRELLQELGARFDVVILDSPPMLLAPESSVLAVHVDGVVLVVRAGAAHRGAVRDAAQQVRTVGANLVGAVLNDPAGKLTASGGYGYYAAAYQYYGRDHQDE